MNSRTGVNSTCKLDTQVNAQVAAMFELLQLPAMQLLIPETRMFPGMARDLQYGS